MRMFFLVLFILSSVLVLGWGSTLLLKGKRRRVWRLFAEKNALIVSNEHFGNAPYIAGEVEGAKVKILLRGGTGRSMMVRSPDRARTPSVFSGLLGRRGIDQNLPRISFGRKSSLSTIITVRAAISPAIQIQRETVWSRLAKKASGEDILTYDRPFDDFLHLRGGLLEVVGAMSSETRKVIYRGFKEHSMQVEKGEVYYEASGVITDPELLQSLLDRMLEVAHSLTGWQAVRESLMQNALEDFLPSVRERNLDLLLINFHEDKSLLQETCRALLQDQHPNLRFRAAEFLEAEGLEVMEALAISNRVEDKLRSSAFKSVLYWAGTQHALGLLDRLLEGTWGEALLLTLVATASEHGHRACAEKLLSILGTRKSRVDLAILLALLRLEVEDIIPRLIALLDDPDLDVQLGTVEGLQQFGGIEAVAPLNLLTRGALRDGKLKRAARSAIRAIQNRATSGGLGQLSLIDEEERGSLSLFDEAE